MAKLERHQAREANLNDKAGRKIGAWIQITPILLAARTQPFQDKVKGPSLANHGGAEKEGAESKMEGWVVLFIASSQTLCFRGLPRPYYLSAALGIT